MKVAMIIANVAPRYGGPSAAVLGHARALSKTGVAVRLVTTSQGGPDTYEYLCLPSEIEVNYANCKYSIAGRVVSMAFYRSIFSAVRWADVVHVNSLYLPHNLVTHLACAIYKKPYVIRPHGTLEPYHRQFRHRAKRLYDAIYGRRYLKAAAGFHFVSESEAHAARDVIGESRSFVVPAAIDVSTHPTPAPAAPCVLFFGRVSAKKRLDLVLKAWPLVAVSNPMAKLRVVGPVDIDQQQVLTELAALRSVEVVGELRGDAKNLELASASVYILPSDNENFGVAVAEAMMHETSVVISDKVALHQLVTSRNAGLVIPSNDFQALAESINYLLSNPEVRSRMAANAKQAIIDEFGDAQVGVLLRSSLAGLGPVVHLN